MSPSKPPGKDRREEDAGIPADHLARFLVAGLLTAVGGRSVSVAVDETWRLWSATERDEVG